MSQTTHAPKYYRPGPRERLVDGLRYGGGIGQWSWLIHRLTGLGILLFLVIHVVDTFLVVAFPATYDHTVAIYGGIWPDGLLLPSGYYWSLRWAFRLGELGLIASVLFHSINGVRVVLFDFWPGAVLHQRRIFGVVMAVFLAIMVPLTVWVILPLRKGPEPQTFPAVPPVGQGGTMAPITAG